MSDEDKAIDPAVFEQAEDDVDFPLEVEDEVSEDEDEEDDAGDDEEDM